MFFLKCKPVFQITSSGSGNCSLFYLDHKKTITWHDLRRGLRRGCDDLPSGFYSGIFCVLYVFSYALFSRESKNKVNEVILTCRNGKVRSCFCDLCLILAINAFLLLLFILYLGLQSRKALGSVQMDVLWFGIRCYLIHIILVNIFAALTGMAVSFIKNEIKAFSVMILLCCCFSQFFWSLFIG